MDGATYARQRAARRTSFIVALCVRRGRDLPRRRKRTNGFVVFRFVNVFALISTSSTPFGIVNGVLWSLCVRGKRGQLPGRAGLLYLALNASTRTSHERTSCEGERTFWFLLFKRPRESKARRENQSKAPTHHCSTKIQNEEDRPQLRGFGGLHPASNGVPPKAFKETRLLTFTRHLLQRNHRLLW